MPVSSLEAADSSTSNLEGGFKIGDWTVEPASGMLRSGDTERRLQNLPMAVLVLLAGKRGAVVTKQEIFDAVWQGAAVEEGALPRCVSEIRAALGDRARQPRYIQTLPKRGYRLIPPVTSPDSEDRAVVDGGPSDAVGKTRPWLARVATVIATTAAIAMVLAWLRGRQAEPVTADSRPTIAVLAIDNFSGNPDHDWLSSALAAMLTTELAISGRLRAVPEAAVAGLRDELSLGGELDAVDRRRLQRALGADFSVVGSFVGSTGSDDTPLRLDLRVLGSGSDEILAAAVVTGASGDLADTVLMAGLRLRQELGLGDDLANEQRLAGTPGPINPAAARPYYEGLHALRRLDPLRAKDLLERSLEADADNPLAHAAMAQVWSALGHDPRAAESARRALALSESLPREDRLWLEARSHGLTGGWDEAIERLEALWLVTADNLEYGYGLADTQLRAGRFDEARATVSELRSRAGDEHRDPRLALIDGEALLRQGKPEGALEAAERAETLARALRAASVEARASVLRAKAAHDLGRGEESEALITEAATAFVAIGDRAAAAEARTTLAEWLEARGDAKRAESLHRQALELFVEIGDKSGEALTLCLLAIHEWNRHGADAGRAMYQRALDLFREIGDRGGEALTLNKLAVSTAIHSAGPVQPLFVQSLAIYREIGDQQGIAKLLMNLGRSAMLGLDLSLAIERFEEAAAVQRQLGQRRSLALTLLNLGSAQLTQGSIEDGERSLGEAIASFREANNQRLLAVGLEILAAIRLQADDAESARGHLEESLALRTAAGDPRSIAFSTAELARAETAAGALEEAEATAREAHEVAVRSGYPPARGHAMAQLGETLLARGLHQEARTTAEALIEELRAFPPPGANMATRRLSIARVLAHTGAESRATRLLDEIRTFAVEKGAEPLRLESELVRAELGLAGHDVGPPVDLDAVRRDAERLGLLRIARLAAALRERIAAHASR